MHQQKGFSLLEVLISLMLVTTLGFALLQMQGQTKQMLSQSLMYAQASFYLDQVNESSLVDKLPQIPQPYKFAFKKDKTNISLHLHWFQKRNFIIRKINLLGFDHE